MIYLDNAATTMHKPQTVIDAVTQAMCSLGNAGRGATSGALDAARTIHGCRAKLARLLGCPRADHVCFTPNSTAALNTAINGVVCPGDRVVTTVLEHNSVLRPLNRLAVERGVTVEHAGCDASGALNYDELERLVTPDTRAVVVTHASNVTGNEVDIARVAAMAHAAGALVIVDASMTELIRPALYGSYHNIENITSEDEARDKYTIVGTACESTDVFDENVTLRKTRRGDLLTIKSAGAYGMSMASRYNLHDLPGAVYSDEIQ